MGYRRKMFSAQNTRQELATVTYSKTPVDNLTSRKIYSSDIRGSVIKGRQYEIEFDVFIHVDELSPDGKEWIVNIWKYGLWTYILRSSGKEDRTIHVSAVRVAQSDYPPNGDNFIPMDTSFLKGYIEISNFSIKEVY